MRLIGNIIWLILTGLVMAIAYLLIGLIFCITIIGIPFGKQCFKLAGLVITPFGKKVNSDFGAHPIANIIWMLLFGWEMAIVYIVEGLLYCITIIGIPFGIQCFKFAHLSFIPFGAKVE